MADQTSQPLITQPPKQNTPEQVRVFAMPVRYRHGAVVSVVEPQKVSVPVKAVVQPPAPPKVLVPIPLVPGKKKTLSSTQKGLIAAGIIVLIALLIGGYLLLRSAQKNKEALLAQQQAVAEAQALALAQQQALQAAVNTNTTPAPSNTGTPSTPVTTPASPFPSAVTPGVDTDSDGLTDVEENIVYNTDAHLPDTDGDGFLDGNEVFHGYNPNGIAPATLVGAGLAQVLQIDGFQLLYPTKWTVLPAQTGNGSVISSSTGETFTVTTSAKDPTLSLSDWYQQTVKEGTPSVSKSRKGYPMLTAKNQLGAYLDLGKTVVSLVYDTSSKATIDYLQTFQMMMNSIELK